MPGLELELRASLDVKTREPVIVVLGNPPYEGFSAPEDEEEKKLLHEWSEPMYPKYKLRKHRLGDLYVRFWRMAIQRIADLTGRGVVSFITNRKWISGRSFPTMREAVVTKFQAIVVDDLHGDVHHKFGGAKDESIFSTQIATGIRLGTAIVTAVRTGDPKPKSVATLEVRDFMGTANEKRDRLEALATVSPDEIDKGLKKRALARKRRWKFTADTGVDFPLLDEYLDFYRSGVQPVRDEAVTDFDRDRLEARMKQYFDTKLSDPQLFSIYPAFDVKRKRYDPPKTRKALLAKSKYDPKRLVPFLYRPLDTRWLYWEPDYKLLNEARRELMPMFIDIPDQDAIVVPVTRRRPGAARPIVSRCVADWHTADPDARLLPRLRKPVSPVVVGADALPFGNGDSAPMSNVLPEWIDAARKAGVIDEDIAVGDCIYYAIVAVMHSPEWLETQSVDSDEFPGVPLPSNDEELKEAARIGRRIAALCDPNVEVSGVTKGTIEAQLRDVAVPDLVSGSVTLSIGTKAQLGGQWIPDDGGTILWDKNHGWRGVPEAVWDFQACGFQVLPKWLSYRVKKQLTAADRVRFTILCRRVAAIIALQPEADVLFTSALRAPLDTEEALAVD